MQELEIGQVAPNFSLLNQDGKEVHLSDFIGKKNIVLYFYPKDMTPGCTQESCDFRDNIARIQGTDTVVLGISKDSVNSHKKFQEKYSFPFDLLSDESTEVQNTYGVWTEKSMYGRKYMGTERSTFLIDKEGIIREIWRKVKVKGHVDEVMEAIESL